MFNVDKSWRRSANAFQLGLVKFQEYLSSLKSPLCFDGHALREITLSKTRSKTYFRNDISGIANVAQHTQTPKLGSPEDQGTQAAFDGREGKDIMMVGITYALPFVLFHMDW